MSEVEKLQAAYLYVISDKCSIKQNEEGRKFWAKIRKRAGVKTVKTGTRKKTLASGNVDHVSVYQTTGFDKVFKAFEPQARPLRKQSCKALYDKAVSLRIWQTYFPAVTFKNGTIQKPKKPPQKVVKMDGKIYALINPDGVITYAKGRDTLWHKAVVQYKILTGDLEIFGAPSQNRASLKKRYTQKEIQLVAFGTVLGQQCNLKMSKNGRKATDEVIARSIKFGEDKLGFFEKHYIRYRVADHNPLYYVVKKSGNKTTYSQRPGDGLHLLVNDVVNGIYKLPCDEIIRRAKRSALYDMLYR